MTTYLLIHGGAHGAWCWDEVRPLLAAAGHTSIAPDLPMDDVGAGVGAWADAAEAALADEDDVVAVAHSFGGLALPVLATRRPLRRMIFVAAHVPTPGRAFVEGLAEHPDSLMLPPDRLGVDEQGRNVVGWETAREFFYPDASIEVARAAFARLSPFAPTALVELCPLDAWPSTPASSVIATDDRVVGAGWQRQMAEQRLRTTPVELSGGHSPLLTRPHELTEALLSFD